MYNLFTLVYSYNHLLRIEGLRESNFKDPSLDLGLMQCLTLTCGSWFRLRAVFNTDVWLLV